MLGPQESEAEFMQRINVLKRSLGPTGKRTKVATKESFPWDVGIRLRSRGTVQSDRWRGKMSALAGDKLIAVVPVLGWWVGSAKRAEDTGHALLARRLRERPWVYAAIQPRVEAASAAISVEV